MIDIPLVRYIGNSDAFVGLESPVSGYILHQAEAAMVGIRQPPYYLSRVG
jgi:hypothetical protein